MDCRTEGKAILVSLITQGIITADNVLPTAFLCNIFLNYTEINTKLAEDQLDSKDVFDHISTSETGVSIYRS